MKKYEVPRCEIIKFDVDDKTMDGTVDVDGDTSANPWGDLIKDPASGNIQKIVGLEEQNLSLQ